MLSRFRSLAKLVSVQPTYVPSFKFCSPEDAESEAAHVAETKPKRTRKGAGPLKNVALVLSGSGVYDGSEITEAVSFLVALSSRNIKYQCYAPNKEQTEVINHLTGKPEGDRRNVLVESARIARGNVKDLKELSSTDYDAVFFPGGFGAAKNLSDFAFKGADMSVDPEVEKVLKEFHEKKKPICLACISPVLAAKVFGESRGVSLTLGQKGEGWPYQGAIEAIEKLGCKHAPKPVNRSHFDNRNLVFSTPAFMKDTTNFSEIFHGIDNFVESVVDHMKKVKEEAAEKKKAKRERRAEARHRKAAEKEANQ